MEKYLLVHTINLDLLHSTVQLSVEILSWCIECMNCSCVHVFYIYIYSCVQKLVQNGAFIAAEDHDCNTPLHIACLKGHLKIAKFLMEHTRVDWEAKFVISCSVDDFIICKIFS